jgi:aminopeptidase
VDERIKKLSHLLVNYSTKVQPKEKVLISYEGDVCLPLAKQLVKDVYAAGGYPYTEIRDTSLTREILLGAELEQIEFMNHYQLEQMKGMDAYIAVRAGGNTSELADVPSDKLNMYNKTLRPVLNYRVNNTKWVVLRFPNNSMAQLANTSLESFENFYYDVCTLDYQKMSDAMDKLVDLMNRTDKVQIKGPGTDLTFSIKDIPAKNVPENATFLTVKYMQHLLEKV